MRSKKYIYANLHKIIRFYVVHNKITTIYNKKRGFPFYWKTSLLCRGDRIRTCDHLVPNQARYRTALHPVSCKVSDFASAKVLIKSEPCKFFYNYLFKKQIISQTLLRETLWLSKRPFNKQLFKP